MEVLRSYVVRVYRQEADGVAGVIESVETGRHQPVPNFRRDVGHFVSSCCHTAIFVVKHPMREDGK